MIKVKYLWRSDSSIWWWEAVRSSGSSCSLWPRYTI